MAGAMMDMNNKLSFRRNFARSSALVIVLTLIVAVGQAASQREEVRMFAALLAASSETSPHGAELMQPDELAKALQASKGEKPVVLYVGPRFLWAQAHIPGAEFIGPNADPQSREKLRARAASLPHSQLVVLYCGCCPWDHCPNIRPTFQELRKVGLEKIRALYLPNSFGTDWAARGFPTAKGEQ
jgi:thiosulfate/3-mercaptopyruvate sulfurtransferase